MGYKYKDGYKRKYNPRSFSLGLDTIERLSSYEEIKWSRVVDKLLNNYLDQLDQMENIRIVDNKTEEIMVDVI